MTVYVHDIIVCRISFYVYTLKKIHSNISYFNQTELIKVVSLSDITRIVLTYFRYLNLALTEPKLRPHIVQIYLQVGNKHIGLNTAVKFVIEHWSTLVDV